MAGSKEALRRKLILKAIRPYETKTITEKDMRLRILILLAVSFSLVVGGLPGTAEADIFVRNPSGWP